MKIKPNLEKKDQIPQVASISCDVYSHIALPSENCNSFFRICHKLFPSYSSNCLMNKYFGNFLCNKSDFLIKNKEEHIIPQISKTIQNTFINHVIKVTGTSNLKVFSSIFTISSECGFQIEDSQVSFKNCYFCNMQKKAVVIRKNSSVTFEECIFDNNMISCEISDHSFVKFISCKFKDGKSISIDISNNSKAKIESCIFINNNGKIINSKSSKIYVTNTNFEECDNLVTNACDSSTLFFKDIKMRNILKSAICVKENSRFEASDIDINNITGNSFIIYNSQGHINNANISDSSSHSVSIFGVLSNPKFINCHFENGKSKYCIVCKNHCWPSFYNCTFSKLRYNCFSISAFSKPHIENCEFTEICGNYMNIKAECKVTLYNNKFQLDFLKKVKADDNTFQYVSNPIPSSEREENFWHFLYENKDIRTIIAFVKSMMLNEKIGENDNQGENNDPAEINLFFYRQQVHMQIVNYILFRAPDTIERQQLLVIINSLSQSELLIQVRNLIPLFKDTTFLEWLTSVTDSHLFGKLKEVFIKIITNADRKYTQNSSIKEFVYDEVRSIIEDYVANYIIEQPVYDFITSESANEEDEGFITNKLKDLICILRENEAQFDLDLNFFREQFKIFKASDCYGLNEYGKSIISLFIAALNNESDTSSVLLDVWEMMHPDDYEFDMNRYEELASEEIQEAFNMDL